MRCRGSAEWGKAQMRDLQTRTTGAMATILCRVGVILYHEKGIYHNVVIFADAMEKSNICNNM